MIDMDQQKYLYNGDCSITVIPLSLSLSLSLLLLSGVFYIFNCSSRVRTELPARLRNKNWWSNCFSGRDIFTCATFPTATLAFIISKSLCIAVDKVGQTFLYSLSVLQTMFPLSGWCWDGLGLLDGSLSVRPDLEAAVSVPGPGLRGAQQGPLPGQAQHRDGVRGPLQPRELPRPQWPWSPPGQQRVVGEERGEERGQKSSD